MLMRTLRVAIALALAATGAAHAAEPEPISPNLISVVVVGTGPDVILIPGLASSRDVCRAS